ncbi:MAG: bifunctional 4-hydroxy-2-oxoglutarate aldolase/2-dehydro-3-deoxy-phosphogluconate aldolase [Candidatus Nanopelagicales bacterium]
MRTATEVTEALRDAGFMPVVTVHDPEDAVPLGEALLRAGLRLVEVTFRTEAAQRAIIRLRAELPELLVAAGTVIDAETVERSMDAGAAFVVSPGLNPEVVDYCVERRIPIVPGANDASEIEVGWTRGVRTFNFFPAQLSGGPAMLQALGRPFTSVEFLCSGGITPQNLASYLALPNVVACAGSWVASPESIVEGRFHQIEAHARSTADIVRAHRSQPTGAATKA